MFLGHFGLFICFSDDTIGMSLFVHIIWFYYQEWQFWARKKTRNPEKWFANPLSLLIREGNGTPLQYSCLENPMDGGAWKAAVHGVAKSRTRLSDFTFTFHFHAWEREMATHSSVLAWRIPGTGEPGGLPSMGSHRVGHNWSDLAAAAAASLLIFLGMEKHGIALNQWTFFFPIGLKSLVNSNEA